jgi:hypothetical protein
MSKHLDSTIATTTHSVIGTVTFVIREGILHQLHAGACLKCGETEGWIKQDFFTILGNATGTTDQPVLVEV